MLGMPGTNLEIHCKWHQQLRNGGLLDAEKGDCPTETNTGCQIVYGQIAVDLTEIYSINVLSCGFQQYSKEPPRDKGFDWVAHGPFFVLVRGGLLFGSQAMPLYCSHRFDMDGMANIRALLYLLPPIATHPLLRETSSGLDRSLDSTPSPSGIPFSRKRPRSTDLKCRHSRFSSDQNGSHYLRALAQLP